MRLFVLLLLATFNIKAQEMVSIHSLRKAYQQNTSLNDKAKIANTIARHCLLYEEDTLTSESLAYTDSVLQQKEKILDKQILDNCYMLRSWLFAKDKYIFLTEKNLSEINNDSEYYKAWKLGIRGILQFRTEEQKKALDNLGKALRFFNRTKNYDQLAFFYRYLGRCFAHYADYASAIDAYHKSDLAFLKLGIQKGICINMRFKGRSYQLYGTKALGDIDNKLMLTAIEHYNQALKCSSELNKPSQMAWDYTVIADLYLNVDSFSLAYKMQENALEIAKKTKSFPLIGLSYNNFGEIELKKGNHLKAIIQFEKAISYFDSTNKAERYRITSLANLSNAYLRENKLDKALDNAQSALALAQKTNDRSKLTAQYKLLAEIYNRGHDNQTAYNNLMKYVKLNAEIYNNDQSGIVIAQNAKFNVEKYKQQTIYTQKTQQWILSLSIVVVVIILILFRLFVLKKKAERKREKAEADLIEEKAKRSEQKKLSRDLHDGHKNNLFVLKFMLESKNELIDLSEAIDYLIILINQIKSVGDNLNTDSLRGLQTLSVGISELLKYSETRKKGINYIFDEHSVTENEWAGTSPKIHDEVLKIVTEAIINIEKHSRATKVTIDIELDSIIYVKIKDNGQGFDTSILGRGNGRKNMDFRAKGLGGVLDTESYPGRGTTVHIYVPLVQDAIRELEQIS